MSDVPIPRDVVDTLDVVGEPRAMRQGGITRAMREWMQYIATTLDDLGDDVAAIPLSPINSVQYGTVTIAGSSATGTATITSVDTSKAVLGFLGFTTTLDTSGGSAVHQNRMFPMITLTNATTVTATRNSSDPSDTVTVSFVVVEYV